MDGMGSWSVVRLELIGSTLGARTGSGGGGHYEIAAGDAFFIAAGKGAGEWATLTVSNSTAITATVSGDEWSFGSFSIQYIDDSSKTWTVFAEPSTWLED